MRAVAILVGAVLYALAFPPYDWAILGWLALVPLLLAVRGRPVAWAFGYGVLYGSACAWGVAGWLAQAMGRFFGVGLPLGVLAASAYAVLFWGSAFGLFAAGSSVLLRPGRSLAARCAVPALWVATELLRGRVLGQPWALLGYSQHGHPALIQIAALTGVYGVSFLLALAGMAAAEALVLVRAERSVRRSIATLALPVALVVPLWLVGAVVAERGPVGGFKARTVAVIQTNVPPSFEWTRAYTDRQLMAHLHATESLPPALGPRLIVWPEHALPRYLEMEPMLAAQLGELARRSRADLLFGAPRYEAGRTYNSVRLITAAGRNGGAYDKQRLVLLAEANPLASAEDAAPSDSPRQFSAGSGPGVLESFLPLGVSICHEMLFPELIARSVGAGAEVLVNVSNDGWLDAGHGVASRQHFAMGVFRAVETRRYLVRAATTGVSGVIDPFGRVIEALEPGTQGVLTAPVAGRSVLTAYVRLGDAFAVGCALAAAAALSRRPGRVTRRYPRLASARSVH